MDKPAKWCNNKTMNKTILLELTEKEAEVVRNAIEREVHYWDKFDRRDVSGILIENTVNSCRSIQDKIVLASEPSKHVLINKKDFFNIMSIAKGEYLYLNGNIHISGEKIEEKYLVHISIANAVIVWLNNSRLLKKLAVFDYTDHSCDYEEME
jgi:hypothetical protein